MSYHIISIDHLNAHISCDRGQLRCDNDGQIQSVPMEDVAAVIITSLKATLTNHFLIEAARHKVGVIVCDTFRPASILLPADRATDTTLLRKLTSLPAKLKQRLWQKTVDAKCLNQYYLAHSWNPNHPSLPALYSSTKLTRSSKESECARLFWEIFAFEFCPEYGFRRGRQYNDVNALFNYAYAVLLSCVLQKLFALGLDPTFGVFHLPREHSTPLAYDLMEPFRPFFDAGVVAWLSLPQIASLPENQQGLVTTEFRRHIVTSLTRHVPYNDKTHPLQYVIELVFRSFRSATISQQSGPYQPWITETIKWDGS